jgi:hypothetical protein
MVGIKSLGEGTSTDGQVHHAHTHTLAHMKQAKSMKTEVSAPRLFYHTIIVWCTYLKKGQTLKHTKNQAK